ncbi:hypothetical protein JYQ62_28590 [Nostoc sp. UHCC 0702]|nr:hypothetical protein JYQ62_28590 [Nostoc sp. UHCC 0702]
MLWPFPLAPPPYSQIICLSSILLHSKAIAGIETIIFAVAKLSLLALERDRR